jgi:hypothetical protein
VAVDWARTGILPRPLLMLQRPHRRTLRALQHLDADGILASAHARHE